MPFQIRNVDTGYVYTDAPTLSAARRYCEQHLLSRAASREGFLSDLAAGLINVYDISHTTLTGAGF